MVKTEELRVLLRGDNSSLLRSIGQADNALGGLGGRGLSSLGGFGLKSAAGLAAMAGAALGGGVALSDTFDRAADFEEKLAAIDVLTAGTSLSLDEIRKRLLGVTTELGVSGGAAETAAAFYEILQAGIEDPTEAFALLDVSIKAARAGMTDTKTTVDGLTNVLNAYGLQADKAGALSDIFFQTVFKGKVSFGELAKEVGGVTAIAPQVGVAFDEVAATFATLTAAGHGAPEVATSLTAAMTEFLTPSESMRARLDELGFETGPQAIRSLGGLVPAIRALTAGMNEAEVAATFNNVRAMRLVFPLIGGLAGKFEDNLDLMAESAGSTDRAFARMADTFRAKSARVRNAIESFQVDAGGAALDVGVTLAANFAAGFGAIDFEGVKAASVTAIRDLGETLGPVAKAAGEGTRDAFAALSTVVLALEPAFRLAGGVVLAVMPSLLAIFESAKAVFAAVTVAVGSFVEGFVKGLGPDGVARVASALTPILDGLRLALDVVAFALGALAPAFGLIGQVVGASVGVFADLVAIVAKVSFDTLSKAFEVVKPVIEPVTKVLEGALEVLTGILTLDFSKISSGLKTAIEGLGKLALEVPTILLGIGTAIVDGIRDGIKSKWDGLVEWFKTLLPQLRDAAFSFFKIASPSQVFEEMGENMVAGLRLGLDSLPRALDPSLDRVELPRGSGGSAAAAPSSRTVTIANLNVTVTTNRDVGRDVGVEIARSIREALA